MKSLIFIPLVQMGLIKRNPLGGKLRILRKQRHKMLVGAKPDQAWTDDEKLDFHSAYIHFTDVFEEKGGLDKEKPTWRQTPYPQEAEA